MNMKYFLKTMRKGNNVVAKSGRTSSLDWILNLCNSLDKSKFVFVQVWEVDELTGGKRAIVEHKNFI